MSFFCRHDWVLIRSPEHIDRAWNHKIIYNGVVVFSNEYGSNAKTFMMKYSDFICSKCSKLDLNMRKLDKIIDRKMSRAEAKKLGLKLIKLADKAKE